MGFGLAIWFLIDEFLRLDLMDTCVCVFVFVWCCIFSSSYCPRHFQLKSILLRVTSIVRWSKTTRTIYPPGALRWASLSKDGLPYSSNMEDISHIWWLCTCNEILVIFIYMYILFILFIYLIIYLFVYLLIYVSVGCISLLSYGRLDIFIRGSIGYWKVIQPCCL